MKKVHPLSELMRWQQKITSDYNRKGLSKTVIHDYRQGVYDYFFKQGRSLPWRINISPYSIFISEMMLQQTRVERVIGKYAEWMKRFPDFTSLAEASTAEVVRQWQGLGYNRRALYTRKAAEMLIQQYNGALPNSITDLKTLSGIGNYSAAAITVFAFNKPAIVIETNIRTVFIHFFFHDQTDISDKDLLPLIGKTQDTKNPRLWYWALMDLGSHIKSTVGNNTRRSKHYKKQSLFKGSSRQLRGKIIRTLTTFPSLREKELLSLTDDTTGHALIILSDLLREGFIEKKGDTYQLRSETAQGNDS